MAAGDWRTFPLSRLRKALDGRLSARKWRLLACAAVRRLRTAEKGAGALAVHLAERFADGGASAHELAAARFAGRFQPGHPAWAVCWGPEQDAQAMAGRALAWVVGQIGDASHLGGGRREEDAQADLLREIAGHRFQRVVVDPVWLAWGDGVVVKVAKSIYEERAFEQMPILGDCARGSRLQRPGFALALPGRRRTRPRLLALDLLLGLS